jgi:hypothetical protein
MSKDKFGYEMPECAPTCKVSGGSMGACAIVRMQELYRDCSEGKIKSMERVESWGVHLVYEEGNPEVKELSRKGETRTVTLTFTYLSPEEVSAKKSGRCDIDHLTFFVNSDPRAAIIIDALMSLLKTQRTEKGCE